MKGPCRASTVRAWCIYRDGDMCTNPKSPVNTSSERRELQRIILNFGLGLMIERGPD